MAFDMTYGTVLGGAAQPVALRNGIATAGDVDVTSSATEIRPAARDRLGLILYNTSSDTVYIGFSSAVTASTGFPLAEDTSVTLDIVGGPVWGVTASGTADVRYIEVVAGRAP